MTKQKIKTVRLQAGAFTSDSDWQVMTDSQRGIYWSIIVYLYENGGRLQYDEKKIKKLCNSGNNFCKNFSAIKHKFKIKNGILTHKRVTAELQKARKYIKQKRLAGLASGKARQTTAEQTLNGAGNGCPTTKAKAKTKLKLSKELSFNKEIRGNLALEIQKKAAYASDKLEMIFKPLTRTQVTTFLHIIQHISKLGKPELFDSLIEWASDAVQYAGRNQKSKDTAAKLFVAKVKKETGFKKTVKIL